MACGLSCVQARIEIWYRRMVERYSNLLGSAARLYERHRANRPRPFNVFVVLRSASDEVNLHSRFLHALLNHVDPVNGKRENLKEFVREVAQAEDFGLANARVERESNYIDLLIANEGQAIVVENKIWAGDRDRQLQRYRDILVGEGYDAASIRLLYLTPEGHKPSPDSVGEIPSDQIKRVSYRDDLSKWLIGCQRRAFDEAGLRESIAQYLQLIRRLTNNDYDDEHMNELKELLLRDDNVVLAGQISRSLVDAEAHLVAAFYGVVDRVLRDVIEDLPQIDPDWIHCIQEKEIRRCVTGGRGSDTGLYYRISESAWLAVCGNDRLWFGVTCTLNDDAELHGDLKQALANVGGRHRASDWAPWWQYLDELPAWGCAGEWLHIREPNEATLKFLPSGEDSLEEFARSVAFAISDLWRMIKRQGLASWP